MATVSAYAKYIFGISMNIGEEILLTTYVAHDSPNSLIPPNITHVWYMLIIYSVFTDETRHHNYNMYHCTDWSTVIG